MTIKVYLSTKCFDVFNIHVFVERLNHRFDWSFAVCDIYKVFSCSLRQQHVSDSSITALTKQQFVYHKMQKEEPLHHEI